MQLISSFLFFSALLSTIFTEIFGNKCILNPSQDLPTSNGRLKWAIIALTKHGASATRERDISIIKMISPYAHLYEISILYFSEINLLQEVPIWQKLYQQYATVHFISTSQHAYHTKEVKYGYKYMCKFFALDLYSHLLHYDYYLRCDTDCRIKNVNYDLFQYVSSHLIEYGYALRKLEAHKLTRETLTPFIEEYIKACEIQPSSVMDQPLRTCFNFYNNFHVGKVSFFLRTDVQHFLQAVNNSGKILTDRWGDSTIQAYAVRIFMSPERVQLIPNFSYVHGSHNGFITTFNEGKRSNIPQALPHWTYVPPN